MQELSATDIQQNLQTVYASIASACTEAGRSADSVRLVAVSKFHPASAVIAALNAGQTLFGENRVQEAAAKFDEVRAQGCNCNLHIIGQLQRNKVKEAVRIADCIESVDRIELMAEIEKQCTKIDKRIQIFFELHTGEESKAGFADVQAVADALSRCAAGDFPHLIPAGFMTMAPLTDDEERIRASFRTLRTCAENMRKAYPQFPLTELSMGMSGDYKLAISEGATIVRIGTAIFGARDYSA